MEIGVSSWGENQLVLRIGNTDDEFRISLQELGLPHHHGRPTSYVPNVDYDDDRGSVWSGSEWRAV